MHIDTMKNVFHRSMGPVAVLDPNVAQSAVSQVEMVNDDAEAIELSTWFQDASYGPLLADESKEAWRQCSVTLRGLAS